LSPLVKRLANAFQLAILEPSKAVEECLTLAVKEENEPEWPVLARLHQLGRTLLAQRKGPDSTIPHRIFAEIIFRKIELVAATPPKPVEKEEEPPPEKSKKKPPKGKEKKQEEDPEPLKNPKGVIIQGFPSDMAQLAAWETVCRAYSSPLLRAFDSDIDMQMQLSSFLAPWWHQEGGPCILGPTSPHMAVGPPIRILRLCHEGHAALCDGVLREATNEGAWETSLFAAGSEVYASLAQATPEPGGNTPLPMPCSTYEQEQMRYANPVDKAWGYQDVQPLARAFTSQLQGSYQDIVAVLPALDPGDENTESPPSFEEVCFAQAQSVIGAMRKWRPDTAELSAPSPQPSDGEKNPDDETQVTEQAPVEQEEAPELPVALPTCVRELWATLPDESREQLRGEWLDCLYTYMIGLRSSLVHWQESISEYAAELVQMQRVFLEFLQRNDDKVQVFSDFLQTWPQ